MKVAMDNLIANSIGRELAITYNRMLSKLGVHLKGNYNMTANVIIIL